VRAVAFGSLSEAGDAGRAAPVEVNGGGLEVLLLAVDVVPRMDVVRKAAGRGARTETDADGPGGGGGGGSVFSPGVGEITEVAKRGWRRCGAHPNHVCRVTTALIPIGASHSSPLYVMHSDWLVGHWSILSCWPTRLAGRGRCVVMCPLSVMAHVSPLRETGACILISRPVSFPYVSSSP
jgi:hypothetical protein